MTPAGVDAWRAPLPRRWWILGGWLCSLVLCAWLYHHLSSFEWQGLLEGVPWFWWPLATLGWFAGYGVRAWRLQQEWADRAWVPWSRCLSLVLRHNAAVLIVPLRLGEASYLIGVARQWGVDIQSAAWSLLRLRLQDAVVVGALAVAWLLPGGVWGVGLSAVALLLSRHRLHRACLRPASRGGRIWNELMRLFLSPGWVHSVVNWSLRLAVIGGWLFLLAPLAPAAAIGAAAGAELGALWPLQGPAGLGPFELGVWTAAQWLGQSPPGLLAAAVTAHLFCITVALLGALVAMWTCGPPPAASLIGESRR